MLVLEELEHAKKRGAHIHGEIIGYGSSADAFRITDSHDEGRGAIACIREALEGARVSPADVDYINAHGTSTSVNDSIETLAIKRTCSDAAYQVPTSSTKSMMGHLIAAAGSVEAVFASSPFAMVCFPQPSILRTMIRNVTSTMSRTGRGSTPSTWLFPIVLALADRILRSS